MPAEWEPHDGCYLVWPERTDTWRLGGKPAQAAFAAVAEAIAATEAVTVLASAEQWTHARSRLSSRVRVVEMSTNDAWARDTGPTFVVDGRGERRAVTWQFNAWGGLRGGLYFPWDADDLVGPKVADLERAPLYRPDIVLEGGAIDVDGEGTALTTRQCVLNANRNPDMSQIDVESILADYLGASTVIWLPRGVHADETDGHVDNLARFVAPGHVVLTWTDDTTDPQHAISSEALDVLQASRDAQGRDLQVTLLHQPGPLTMTAEEASGIDEVQGTLPRRAGERLAASYVNAYLGNDVVVVPVFDDPHDVAALCAYADLLPGRRIVPVPGREILLGGGNVHCITQQVPARSTREPTPDASRRPGG